MHNIKLVNWVTLTWFPAFKLFLHVWIVFCLLLGASVTLTVLNIISLWVVWWNLYLILQWTMFSRVELCKTDQFLDKSRTAREERASERQKECASIKIQAEISFMSFIQLLLIHAVCVSMVIVTQEHSLHCYWDLTWLRSPRPHEHNSTDTVDVLEKA